MTKQELEKQLKILKRVKDFYITLIKDEECSFFIESKIGVELKALNKALSSLQVTKI